jgi:hypothetical protein
MTDLSRFNNSIILIKTYRFLDEYLPVFVIRGNVSTVYEKYCFKLTNNECLNLYEHDIESIMYYDNTKWDKIIITENRSKSLYNFYINLLNKEITLKSIFNLKNINIVLTDVTYINNNDVAIYGRNSDKSFYELDSRNYELV